MAPRCSEPASRSSGIARAPPSPRPAKGRRDALAGVVGMLLGAGAFVSIYPQLKPALGAGGDFGKVTLPGATSSRDWAWVTGLTGAALAAAGAGELAPVLQRRFGTT